MASPDTYLIRYGELALKKRNRRFFERALLKSIRTRIAGLGGSIEVRHKKMLLRCEADPQLVREALSTVFGISSVSPIWRIPHDIESICELAWQLVRPLVGSGKTFAVRAKRAQKGYPMTSPQIQLHVAGYLYERGLDLPVDLIRPEVCLGISIEFTQAWVHLESWPGLGGLPQMPRNRFGLLLSGGIDSPVAGHMIQKRGGHLDAIYFHTPPYTVEGAKEKALRLATQLARFQSHLNLYCVNFTDTMKQFVVNCDQKYMVILSRRFMMRVAEQITRRFGGHALVTGENLSQVASQTIQNIAVINQVVSMPVLRPLIGFDKTEIIQRARRLGSYDISIEPFQDCCTLFSPRHPATRSRPAQLEVQESRLDIATLVEQAVESTEVNEVRVYE